MNAQNSIPSNIDLSVLTWSHETKSVVQACIKAMIKNGNTFDSQFTWGNIVSEIHNWFFTDYDAFCTMVQWADYDNIVGRDHNGATFFEPANKDWEVSKASYLHLPLQIAGRVKNLLKAQVIIP